MRIAKREIKTEIVNFVHRNFLCVALIASMFFMSGNVIAGSQPGVSLRKFPYPYRSMIAWINDTDELSPIYFEEVHRFLNTLEKDIPGYGDGVGLDIGDSFWFMAKERRLGVAMYYGPRNADGAWKNENNLFVLKYLKAGWIDSLHSYSSTVNHEGFSFTRADAVYLVDWLKKHNIYLDVWIDHGDNSSNVGTNWGHGKGSTRAAPEYHDDITFRSDHGQGYGFRFGWIFSGREHRNINQEIEIEDVSEKTLSRAKIGGNIALRTAQNQTPISMKITKIDYAAKILYAEVNNLGRHTMLEYQTFLDSRHTKVWEFSRVTSDRNGRIWYANLLDKQVTRENLDYLAEKGLYEIFAIHLGYWASQSGGAIQKDISWLLPEESINAFRLVKTYQDRGKILVARGSRLLKYNLANDFLAFRFTFFSSRAKIIVDKINDPWLGAFTPTIDDLRGITFYCDNPTNTDIYIGNSKVSNQYIQRNPADFTGKKSIGIKWYAPDYTDYTQFHIDEKENLIGPKK